MDKQKVWHSKRERERERKAFVPSVTFAECFPSVKQHGPSVTHPSRILELADFPGGPVVKEFAFQCRRCVFVLW